jgi:hypothetical protein
LSEQNVLGILYSVVKRKYETLKDGVLHTLVVIAGRNTLSNNRTWKLGLLL